MRKLLRFYERLDRKLFIDGTTKFADLDRGLHIECGQVLPKPSLVLLMTKMLELDKSCKVLEIGTGSGYHAAFLAEFAGELHTVEIMPELARKARERLDELGYTNIQYRVGDGNDGWPENAPYDRIVMTASAAKEPLELLRQLKPQGIMVAPHFTESGRQDLMMYCKNEDIIETYRISGVRYVPMINK